MLLAFDGGLYALKTIALVTRQKPRTPTGLVLFLFAWPGVFPDAFRERPRRSG